MCYNIGQIYLLTTLRSLKACSKHPHNRKINRKINALFRQEEKYCWASEKQFQKLPFLRQNTL
jgi:hypothetical protein